MKIIITEDQYNKLSLRRRLGGMLNIASELIDMGDEFYGNLDFCKYYPTFQKYIKNIVGDIIEHYHSPNYDIDDISDFIYEDIGHETFVKLLMDEHGAKIRSFYNRKTRDC
jgi:hypothetical protein